MPMNGIAIPPARRAGRMASGLCTETQGREIVAALVNDAVEEALGFARVDVSNRAADVTDAPDETAAAAPGARR